MLSWALQFAVQRLSALDHLCCQLLRRVLREQRRFLRRLHCLCLFSKTAVAEAGLSVPLDTAHVLRAQPPHAAQLVYRLA